MSPITVKFRVAVVLALATFASAVRPTISSAADGVSIKVHDTYELDSVGNATVKMIVTGPTAWYTRVKINHPNAALLLRKIGIGRNWEVLEEIGAKFNDSKSQIEVSFKARGFARNESGDQWTMQLSKEPPLELIDIHDRSAIYQGAMNSGGTALNEVAYIVTPQGSKNLKHNTESNTFSYDYVPKPGDGKQTDASIQVEAKDSIMSCLAKCYSNENFGLLWVAKSRFDNKGTSTLSNYRIRFRVAGFSNWSAWRQTAKVYPRQTVVDPFFPVFEVEKLWSLTATRTADLEYEMEYRRPDGQLVTENDTKKVQLLGYNETIFTGLAAGEVTSLADSSEFLPMVVASFSAPNDPVVQQLVGRVSGLVPNGANNASGSNENATAFAKALYEWMVANKIAYQTPPAYVNGAARGQHIKFARDVIRNHAGTCIDLAIFWASACESVSLQTQLVLTKDHCFPVIKLPQGGILAVESTGIAGHTFDEAIKYGAKEVEQYKDHPELATFVDIHDSRLQGVQPIDLPKVADTFLADMGYSFSDRLAQSSTSQDAKQPDPTTPGQGGNADKRTTAENTDKRPATDRADQRTTPDNADKRPEADNAEKRPAAQTAEKRPVTDKAAERTATNNAAKRPPAATAKRTPTTGSGRQSTSGTKTPKTAVAAFVGKWRGTFTDSNGVKVLTAVTLAENGGMAYLVKVTFPNGVTDEMRGSGSWKTTASTLVLTETEGVINWPFQMTDGKLIVFLADFGVDVTMSRT